MSKTKFLVFRFERKCTTFLLNFELPIVLPGTPLQLDEFIHLIINSTVLGVLKSKQRTKYHNLSSLIKAMGNLKRIGLKTTETFQV